MDTWKKIYRKNKIHKRKFRCVFLLKKTQKKENRRFYISWKFPLSRDINIVPNKMGSSKNTQNFTQTHFIAKKWEKNPILVVLHAHTHRAHTHTRTHTLIHAQERTHEQIHPSTQITAHANAYKKVFTHTRELTQSVHLYTY